MKKSFLPLAIRTFQLLCSTTMCGLFPLYVVHIIDSLPTNSEPLQFRSQSKDNDLGMHTLTLCLVGGFEEGFGKGKEKVCGGTFGTINCYWSGRSDGFYYSKDMTTWTKVYDWNL
ncbi:hypothetical protein ACSBR2_029423 [Camellia fascicularis]